LDTAQALDATASGMRRQVDAWYQHLSAAGVEPDDAHVYRSAAQVRVDRVAARLGADQPDWLVALIGIRPTKAMPAQVWDDTVRDIATHQLRSTDESMVADLDPRLLAQIAAARVWLADYTDTPAVPPVTPRSHAELVSRRRELDAILDSAPADYRNLITELRDGGQLSFDDTTQLLTDALAAQDARTRWILAHWPHVVEYAEAGRALEASNLALAIDDASVLSAG